MRRSPSPPKSPGKDEGDRHPVFSDYSHMTSNVKSLVFAVGLRCDNPQQVVDKMLPLMKIVPAPVKKESLVIKPVQVDNKPCTHPDCIAKIHQLAQLQSENEPLRQQLKALEAKVLAAKNKIPLTENATLMAEEKNEELQLQIDEMQINICSCEAEAVKRETQNQALRLQLADLQKEVTRLKAQTEEKTKTLQVMKEKAAQEVAFHRKNANSLSRDEVSMIEEINALRFDEDSASDDDE